MDTESGSDSSHMGMDPTKEQSFRRISVEEALAILQRRRMDGLSVKLFDIRDAPSYEAGHFPGALRLGPVNLDVELADADHATPVLIYCYHGHSSQRAAGLFAKRGFESCSIDGGWEFLRTHLPRD